MLWANHHRECPTTTQIVRPMVLYYNEVAFN